MTAFVSVHHRGLLIEAPGGFELLSSEGDVPQQVDREVGEILLNTWSDAIKIEVTDAEHGIKELEAAMEQDEALFVALFALDPKMKTADRSRSIDLLPSVAVGDALHYVEKVLASEEIPASADFEGAIELCRRAGLYAMSDLFSSTLVLKEQIARVRRAWGSLPDEVFGGPIDRRRVQVDAVRQGFFLGLAKRANDIRQINAFEPMLPSSAPPERATEIGALLQEALRELLAAAWVDAPAGAASQVLFADDGDVESASTSKTSIGAGLMDEPQELFRP